MPRTLVAVRLADAYAPIDSPRSDGCSWPSTDWACRPSRAGRRRRRVRAIHVSSGPDGRELAFTVAALPARRASRPSDRRLGGDRRPDRPGPARTNGLQARRVDQGARDPPRRGPTIRLDRGRDRPAGGGPRRRDGARPQPRALHRAVPSGWFPGDGLIGQYSLGGPENKRAILASEGSRPPMSSGSPHRPGRHPLHRLRHDPDLLPADVPRGTTDQGTSPSAVPPPPSRVGGRGYRACRQCRPGSAVAA